jgi:hypothetical protein
VLNERLFILTFSSTPSALRNALDTFPRVSRGAIQVQAFQACISSQIKKIREFVAQPQNYINLKTVKLNAAI